MRNFNPQMEHVPPGVNLLLLLVLRYRLPCGLSRDDVFAGESFGEKKT